MRSVGELLEGVCQRMGIRVEVPNRERLHLVCPGCGQYVELRERAVAGRPSPLRFFGAVCKCGRGIDATCEKMPANEVKL